MDIKAIETVYNGYRFRSRLEARWAVFFDALGIEYEYEPEGFDLANGMRYLPDFKLLNWRGRDSQNEECLWVEIKPKMNATDAEKVNMFCGKLERPMAILSDIPQNYEDWLSKGFESLGFGFYSNNFHCIDGDFFSYGIAPTVDTFSDGYIKQYKTFELCGADSSYWDDRQIEIVNKALLKAKMSRFEFGETPQGEHQ